MEPPARGRVSYNGRGVEGNRLRGMSAEPDSVMVAATAWTARMRPSGRKSLQALNWGGPPPVVMVPTVMVMVLTLPHRTCWQL
jgi:hypothetical protein